MHLLSSITGLLAEARREAVQKINTILVETYWHVGEYIVNYEQKGKLKAKYGEELLEKLSRDLTKNFGKGFSLRNLRDMRNFFRAWPHLLASVNRKQIRQTVSAEFKTSHKPIRQTSSAESQNAISQTLSAKFKIPRNLLQTLSWSHFVRLLSIKDTYERNFYLIETSQNTWSVRELDRQINSCLFERLALSKTKHTTRALTGKGQIIEKPEDLVKDPYVLEFLGLEERPAYTEKDLETAIIDNLEKFLLEMGKGFTFVARQQRISAGSDHFYIDLVLYNRILRSFVLIDLKIGKVTHQDLGQMQMYVNWYDRKVKREDERETIGIILCKEKHDIVVKYTLPEANKQIFAKEYRLYLPKKKALRKLLGHYLKNS